MCLHIYYPYKTIRNWEVEIYGKLKPNYIFHLNYNKTNQIKLRICTIILCSIFQILIMNCFLKKLIILINFHSLPVILEI